MDQMILEQQMLDEGAQRYQKAKEKAINRQDLTAAQNKMFKDAVLKVSDEILKEHGLAVVKRGPKQPWVMAVDALGPLTCAALTLRVVFGEVTTRANYTKVIEAVGQHLEVQMVDKAVKEKDEKAYKRLCKGAKTLSTSAKVKDDPNQSLRGKVFTEWASDAGFWNPMEPVDVVRMGSFMLNFVLKATGLFNVCMDDSGTDEQVIRVELTSAALDRLSEIEEAETWMSPVYKAMLVPPADWVNAFTGCYQDQRIAKTFPIIKTGNREHLREVNEAVKANAPFVQALNIIQATPMRINAFVLEWIEKAFKNNYVIKSFPDRQKVVIPKDASRTEKEELRKKKANLKSALANFMKDIREAKEYAQYNEFFLPGQLDWRGRVYAKPHLNHQREDYCKALFEMGRGKPIGIEGGMWLAIHVATTGAFDGIEKAPLDQRYQWTRDNSERIVEMVKDPAKHQWWTQADKGKTAFAFLAAAKAWAEYEEQGESYVCHLPVAVDGSNSGLQHFSAFLRDSIGAKEVNLIPQEKPADVYKTVAELVLKAVQPDAGTNIFADRWLSIGITRSVSKRCCMVYVYGSKQFGFAEHLADDFGEELRASILVDFPLLPGELDWQFRFRLEQEVKKTAHYLAKHLWQAVKETVKSAADGMDWLQEVAGIMATENLPVRWVTPTGFPVQNAYFKPKVERIELFLFDRAMEVPKRVVPRVKVGDTDDLVKRKCRSSVSPNVVHSLDAAHLQKVVIKAHSEGITDLLLIHDSFGCLPADMPRYVQIVRETFVEMYEEFDPLKAIYESSYAALSDKGKARLPLPPSRGDFDLSLVLESHYAFA